MFREAVGKVTSVPVARRLAPVTAMALFSVLPSACGSSPSPEKSSNQLVEAGLSAEKAGNVDKAFSDYEAAVTKDPRNKYAHYDLGYVYQIRGDAPQAAVQYAQTLYIDPNFSQALYNVGVLETPIDPATAIRYYEKDLKVEPHNASANFNLGVLLVKSGQTAVGDSYIETGLRLNPGLSADLPPGITVPTTSTTKP